MKPMGKASTSGKAAVRRPAERVSDYARHFIIAVGWVCVGGFGGQLIQNLPPITSICGLVASGTAVALSHFWHLLAGALRVLAAIVALLVIGISAYIGVREYTGASYPLYYQACGTPTFSNGYVDSVTFGIEWVNPDGKSLWAHLDKHELTAADRRTALPAPDETVEIKPLEAPGGNGKADDRVDFDPPLTPKTMSGRVHQEWSVGPDKDHLRRTVIIDGTYTMGLTETPDGPIYSFHYSPTSKGSSRYVGQCDIGPHLHGEPVPQV
jgi:hypothetical protein